jgi:hypothetical protein
LKALAGAFVTDPTAEEVDGFTRFQRASASPAVAARLLEVYYDTDIRALLPAIRAPTAVLHREGDKGTRFELGREVAALIPCRVRVICSTTATGQRSWRRCSASCASG